MPRWASRITLEVTDVRVQRVQEISADDARAEGVELLAHKPGNAALSGDECRKVFCELWDSLNNTHGYGWPENPWVWAVTFKRVQP